MIFFDALQAPLEQMTPSRLFVGHLITPLGFPVKISLVHYLLFSPPICFVGACPHKREVGSYSLHHVVGPVTFGKMRAMPTQLKNA